jgi:hypothetical protein
MSASKPVIVIAHLIQLCTFSRQQSHTIWDLLAGQRRRCVQLRRIRQIAGQHILPQHACLEKQIIFWSGMERPGGLKYDSRRAIEAESAKTIPQLVKHSLASAIPPRLSSWPRMTAAAPIPCLLCLSDRILYCHPNAFSPFASSKYGEEEHSQQHSQQTKVGPVDPVFSVLSFLRRKATMVRVARD